jgi:hypothetical protein
MKLLAELGLKPDLAESPMSAGTREILDHVAALDWALLTRLKITQDQNKEIAQFLHSFLEFHLNRVPKGRPDALAPDRS